MIFEHTNLGIASSIYIVLYTLFIGLNFLNGGFIFTKLMMFTQIHAVMKLIGQIMGVLIAKRGFEPKLVCVYTIFNSNAAIPLIMAGLCFLFKSNGQMGEAAQFSKKREPRKHLFFSILKVLVFSSTFVALVCNIAASIVLVNYPLDELDQHQSMVTIYKILKTIGQAMFLGQNVTVFIMTTYTIVTNQNFDLTFSIIATFIISTLLVVRGLYGVISIYILKMSIYSDQHTFVVFEYTMEVTMEYIAVFLSMWSYCCLLDELHLDFEQPFLTEEDIFREEDTRYSSDSIQKSSKRDSV